MVGFQKEHHGTIILCMRCDVFMVVKIHVGVFWVVMLCSAVVGYYFRGSRCLHLQHEDGCRLWPELFYAINNYKLQYLS